MNLTRYTKVALVLLLRRLVYLSLISIGSLVFNHNHHTPTGKQQAGRDTGGKQLQWQAMEGLGAIAFTDGNYEKATRYFKQALALAGESAAPNNKFVSLF